MQSGGPTPVINRSLWGVVDEAAGTKAFGRLYGARHTLEGLLGGELSELGGLSKTAWARLSRTPGAALGSSRRKLRPEETPAVFEALAQHDIRYLFLIGGNDSAETGHQLHVEAQKAGYPLSVLNVPKTIDNDLVLTDHTPGYGSAARFIALAAMGAGRDAEAMGREAPVTLVEVMGRDAGWLAASAALARREPRDAPHVICVPEVPVNEERFLARMEEAYRRFGFAVAVVSENARGTEGVLGGQREPWYVDDFGHPYFDGPARYLAGLLGHHLGVRARYEKPGTIQRSLSACVSQADAREAEMAGRAAVRAALEGHSDRIVTLVRDPQRAYACTTGLAPLEQVAGRVRTMTGQYLDPETGSVTQDFLDYVRPLVGAPLPRFGRLG